MGALQRLFLGLWRDSYKAMVRPFLGTEAMERPLKDLDFGKKQWRLMVMLVVSLLLN